MKVPVLREFTVDICLNNFFNSGKFDFLANLIWIIDLDNFINSWRFYFLGNSI